MTVTLDTIISDVINEDINAAKVFFESGMYCVGCPSSAGESIQQAAAVHGIDAQELVKNLNNYFAAKNIMA